MLFTKLSLWYDCFSYPWCCNDIGKTSLSISLWHCWYILNKHMTTSICDINLTSRSWDLTNEHRRDNGHYPAKKNPPESYPSSVSATIMPRLYCGNWKSKLQVTFFLSCCYEKYVFFSSKQRYSTYTLLYYKLFLML